jgi:hypothetical protein
MAKKEITNPALETWIALNDALRDADEKLCQELLDEELAGRQRQQFIRRIHSRLNKARADKEREDLGL